MFQQVNLSTLSLLDVSTGIGISFLLGAYVAFIYRQVTRGATYSASILRTLTYLSMIVALVMMIISNQIARAFTLVGALAVIRFRTPVKDSKDAAFIFLALAAGMGAGVGLYAQTALGIVLIGLLIFGGHYLRFRPRGTQEALVKFTVPLGEGDNSLYHEEVFQGFLREYKLINARSLHETGKLEITFLVKHQKTTDMIEFSRALSAIPQISKVSIIVSEDEGLEKNIL